MFNSYRTLSIKPQKKGIPFLSLLFLLLVGAFATLGAAEPVAIDLAKRTWQGIPGLERTPKGRVFVSWFTGGTHEPKPENTVVLSQSDDGGRTFSSPQPMALPLDDGTRCYDPCLWIDPRGRLWYLFNRSVKDSTRHGVYARVCDAPDASPPLWGAEFRIGFEGPFSFRMNKPTVLSTGEWVMPVIHALESVVGWAGFDPKQVHGAAISTDEGKNWTLHGAVRTPKAGLENMVVELRDGRLWMLVRTEKVLWESFSSDKGQTWTEGKPTTIGTPHSRFFIRRLASGNLLLVNHSKFTGRSHLTAQISTDDGTTWNDGLLLDERSGVSYPDGVQAGDGLIWITYDRDRGGAGEILLAKFKEDDVIAGKDTSGTVSLKQVVNKLDKPSRETRPTASSPASIENYRSLVRTETWTEAWPDASGKLETRTVTAEVWTAAMQAALDERKSLHIPARDHPYYLDGPLVLNSWCKLTAEPKAEIRLKPGSNSCMVRNANILEFNNRPVPEGTNPDNHISIEGGIWTTLANDVSSNGNERGRSAKEKPVFGTHGVILLQNVRDVSVKNLTIRQSRPFGVHLANAHDFKVENITLEKQRRDGVHVNGPASNGLIRGVRGDSRDDNIALNAWEWKNYAPSYGPVERIVIEDVTGSPEELHAANSIRLLPGVKRFEDGSTLDCPIQDITLRRITDIRDFKLYDQPNLELGRDKDFSQGVGSLKNIYLEDLVFNRPGSIQIHANTDGLVIRGAKLLFPTLAGHPLVEVGPKSMTYRGAQSNDPSRWVEIFSPDLDCTVRNLRISGVRHLSSQADLPDEQVVKVVEQRINPDYPKTLPKGGTGKGLWIR